MHFLKGWGLYFLKLTKLHQKTVVKRKMDNPKMKNWNPLQLFSSYYKQFLKFFFLIDESNCCPTRFYWKNFFDYLVDEKWPKILISSICFLIIPRYDLVSSLICLVRKISLTISEYRYHISLTNIEDIEKHCYIRLFIS